MIAGNSLLSSRERRNAFDYVYGNFRTKIMCSRNRPDFLHEEMEEKEKDEEAKEQHTDSKEYHCAHLCLCSLPDIK